MKKRKRPANLPQGPAILLVGLVVSTLALFICLFIMTLFSLMSTDPTSLTKKLGLAALLIGGAVGGFITARLKGEGGLLVSVLSAVLFALILLIIGVIASRGALTARCAIGCLCYFGTATLGALLGGRKRGRRRRR